MILDGLLLFSSAQAITVTAASTNVVDLVNARDLGVGDDPAMKVMIRILTAFTAGGAATLQTQFQGSTDNSTYTTYAESDAVALASLTAGAVLFPIHLPRRKGGTAKPRYYRLNYIVATGPMTAGTLTAALVLDDQSNDAAESYPAGLTVAN